MSNKQISSNRFHDHAYVLHSRAYQNTSLLVDVFTREHGRIGLVAKGARRSGSAFYGVLQPFQLLEMNWGGRSELKTMYNAETVTALVLAADNDRIYTGMYLNELLFRFLHTDDPHPRLFDSYRQCLEILISKQMFEAALRYFELFLLEESGYGIDLFHDCDSGQEINEKLNYVYVPERGLTNRERLQSDELIVSGSTLQALGQQNLANDEQMRESKLLLRRAIEYHLDGIPLRSRELLRQKKSLSEISQA